MVRMAKGPSFGRSSSFKTKPTMSRSASLNRRGGGIRTTSQRVVEGMAVVEEGEPAMHMTVLEERGSFTKHSHEAALSGWRFYMKKTKEGCQDAMLTLEGRFSFRRTRAAFPGTAWLFGLLLWLLYFSALWFFFIW